MPKTISAFDDHPIAMPAWRDIVNEVLFWGGLATMILGIVGEALGWWNDLGIALTVGGGVGSIIGGVGAIRSLFDKNGSRVAAGFKGLVTKQDQMLLQQGKMLGRQDETLKLQRRMLAKQDLAMERFDQFVRLQEAVRDLLDERLPRA